MQTRIKAKGPAGGLVGQYRSARARRFGLRSAGLQRLEVKFQVFAQMATEGPKHTIWLERNKAPEDSDESVKAPGIDLLIASNTYRDRAYQKTAYRQNFKPWGPRRIKPSSLHLASTGHLLGNISRKTIPKRLSIRVNDKLKMHISWEMIARRSRVFSCPLIKPREVAQPPFSELLLVLLLYQVVFDLNRSLP